MKKIRKFEKKYDRFPCDLPTDFSYIVVQPLAYSDRLLFNLTAIYVKSMYKVRGFVRESTCPPLE